jgi:pentatricopeptide repeat protein
MIYAFSKSGRAEKAVEMFDSMKDEGIKPNIATFNTILKIMLNLAGI